LPGTKDDDDDEDDRGAEESLLGFCRFVVHNKDSGDDGIIGDTGAGDDVKVVHPLDLVEADTEIFNDDDRLRLREEDGESFVDEEDVACNDDECLLLPVFFDEEDIAFDEDDCLLLLVFFVTEGVAFDDDDCLLLRVFLDEEDVAFDDDDCLLLLVFFDEEDVAFDDDDGLRLGGGDGAVSSCACIARSCRSALSRLPRACDTATPLRREFSCRSIFLPK
jgi:hypothetical protein